MGSANFVLKIAPGAKALRVKLVKNALKHSVSMKQVNAVAPMILTTLRKIIYVSKKINLHQVLTMMASIISNFVRISIVKFAARKLQTCAKSAR